jgi:hypothetical protein
MCNRRNLTARTYLTNLTPQQRNYIIDELINNRDYQRGNFIPI